MSMLVLLLALSICCVLYVFSIGRRVDMTMNNYLFDTPPEGSDT